MREATPVSTRRRWFEGLLQDIGFGGRLLRRAPGFTITALLTLALGIGLTTAVFSVVDAVLLKPLPFPDPGRLVMLGDRLATVAALAHWLPARRAMRVDPTVALRQE